jgi:hypothetical protein
MNSAKRGSAARMSNGCAKPEPGAPAKLDHQSNLKRVRVLDPERDGQSG